VSHARAPAAIPAVAGVGLRGPHVAAVVESRPRLGWFEVHAENYMGGGPALRRLEAIRWDYPLSLHGVGLSLGSVDGLDHDHVTRLGALVTRIEPGLISEHLSWSATGGIHLNDLLPLPYTEESLETVCRNVARAQESLGRAILVENPSSYLRFRHSTIPEPEFLAAVARRTGCGILCDVNNIYVTSENFGLDPVAHLDALPPAAVGEIHLAGHFRTERQGRSVLIDDHGARVAAPVWALYHRALGRFGRRPTLIEWDKQLPELGTLLDEARIADAHADAWEDDGNHARVA
jgi:uncharacterized protein (UPF0276 family)